MPANRLPSSSNHLSSKNNFSRINYSDKFLETYPLVNANCVVITSGECECLLNSKNCKRINHLKSRSNVYENQQQSAKYLNNETHNLTPPSSISHYRQSFDEANMIHEGLERVEAEKMLKPLEVGNFLLRRRNEGNLALSLRSTDGNIYF